MQKREERVVGWESLSLKKQLLKITTHITKVTKL